MDHLSPSANALDAKLCLTTNLALTIVDQHSGSGCAVSR